MNARLWLPNGSKQMFSPPVPSAACSHSHLSEYPTIDSCACDQAGRPPYLPGRQATPGVETGRGFGHVGRRRHRCGRGHAGTRAVAGGRGLSRAVAGGRGRSRACVGGRWWRAAPLVVDGEGERDRRVWRQAQQRARRPPVAVKPRPVGHRRAGVPVLAQLDRHAGWLGARGLPELRGEPRDLRPRAGLRQAAVAHLKVAREGQAQRLGLRRVGVGRHHVHELERLGGALRVIRARAYRRGHLDEHVASERARQHPTA